MCFPYSKGPWPALPGPFILYHNQLQDIDGLNNLINSLLKLVKKLRWPRVFTKIISDVYNEYH